MRFLLISLLCIFSLPVASAQEEAESEIVYARIQTSMGDIDLALDKGKAPISVENFLTYATSGFYDRQIFHRVIDDKLIQAGGYSVNLIQRPTHDPIKSESDNGLLNDRGTIGMARYSDPDSATSQFYINLSDNPNLNRSGDVYKKDAGYTIFGKVVAGMEVADAIGDVETGSAEAGSVYLPADVPVEPVLILRIDPIEADEVTSLEAE